MNNNKEQKTQSKQHWKTYIQKLTYKLRKYKSMIIHTFHQRSSLHCTLLLFTLNFSLTSTFRRFMNTLQIPSLHLAYT
jgi:hypothetical protein